MATFELRRLKFKDGNPRKRVEGVALERLKNSIADFPKMMGLRPLVYDPDTMEVLGGNQRLLALLELGYEEVPEEWVKSAADLSEEEKHRFIVQDNIQAGEWDTEALLAGWDADALAEWGLDLPPIGEDLEEEEKYTKKIEAPKYEPKDEKPEVDELYDWRKVQALVEEVEEAEIPEEVKEFLRIAAYRHCVFDYQKIADFYAYSDPVVQDLMEKSALVIIDFDKAIENGFVQLTDEISDLYINDEE